MRRHSKAQLSAWREARVQNYINTRSLDALARMVVELEDSCDFAAEFDIDEAWPTAVQHMRIR